MARGATTQGKGRAYQPPVDDRGGGPPESQKPRGASVRQLTVMFVLVIFGGLAFIGLLMGTGGMGANDTPELAAPDEGFKTAYAGQQPDTETVSPALDLVLEGEVEDIGDVAIAPAPPRPAPAKKSVSAPGAAGGDFVAQIAALRSKPAAQAAWARFAKLNPDLFRSVKQDIETADLGEKGVYHRLRAGYFPDRAAANQFCAGMRDMGQECIVTTIN